MDIDVYSLAQRAPIKLSVVRAVITDPLSTPRDYYERCREIFPIVLGAMTTAEIEGQRSLVGFEQDNFHKASERFDTYKLMRKACHQLHDDDYHLPANQLPDAMPELPLYASWRRWGCALYGRDDFLFGLTETLRRDAAPVDRVIGDGIHPDCTVQHSYDVRALSMFAQTVDKSLASPADEQGAFWGTYWCDGRAITFEESYAIKKLGAYSNESYQALLAARCQSYPLPANHIVVMPTDTLHHASNFSYAPMDYDDRFPIGGPQPKAYIPHTKMRLNGLGQLRF